MTDPLDAIDFDSPPAKRMLRDAMDMPLVEPGQGRDETAVLIDAVFNVGFCFFVIGVVFGVVLSFVVVSEALPK